MNSSSIRTKLYDYIRVADDKKVFAIYNLLENEIECTTEWWKNQEFTDELENRYHSLETGDEKGFTIDDLKTSIEKLKAKRYGK